MMHCEIIFDCFSIIWSNITLLVFKKSECSVSGYDFKMEAQYMNNNLKIDENTFFRDVTIALCSNLDLEAALSAFLYYIKDYMPVAGVTMGLFHPDSYILNLNAQATVDGVRASPKRIMIQKENQDRAQKAWRNEEKFLFFNDLDKTERWRRDLYSLGWPKAKSLVVMYLDSQGQRVGVFAIYAKEKNQYTDNHLHLLKLIHDPLTIALSNALKHQELLRLKELMADDNLLLRRQLLHVSGDNIIGADSGLKGVMEMVGQVADLDSTVIIIGETGVGKEVIANSLHLSSNRKDGPFIKVNCGAIPESLIDSELFGHEKGAFTGAHKQRRGSFEQADKGTIFLDEIAELPASVQVRLLRVIQTKEFLRVGGTSPVHVDVRIISATHRNMDEMIKKGRFREDLWFRLNVFPIMIPPLRQRKGDIPSLVNHFIEKKSIEMKIRNIPSFEPDALEKLMAYNWPGNVRELENIVERALIRSRAENTSQIIFENPSPSMGASKNENTTYSKNEFSSFEVVVRGHILKALELSGGSVYGSEGAARLLNLNPSTLRGKMRKLGIPHGHGK